MASSKDPEQRSVAEAKKAVRERDAQIAMREYHAEKARVDANTAKLRELRLAREAAEAQAPQAPKVKSAPAKKAAARVANPARRTPTRKRT
jgi:hypothetical protein